MAGRQSRGRLALGGTAEPLDTAGRMQAICKPLYVLCALCGSTLNRP